MMKHSWSTLRKRHAEKRQLNLLFQMECWSNIVVASRYALREFIMELRLL